MNMKDICEFVDSVHIDDVRELIDEIYEITHGTILPILWAVLGIFFVVKGALLGIQIVKSADEPQVRQEKIGALKWLAIGVAVAYAATFLVDAVMGFFSGAFK